MNQKEALTALMLGMKVRRKRWHNQAYVTKEANKLVMNFSDGTYLYSNQEEFMTQDHYDWEICPQGNEQNP